MRLTRRQFCRNTAAGIVGIAAAPAISSCAAANAGRELRFAHVQSESHYTTGAAEWMATEVGSATGDELGMQIFTGGSLGSPDAMILSLQSGDLDLCWVSTGQLAREVHELNIFSCSYVIRDRDHFRRLSQAGSPVFEGIRDLVQQRIDGVRVVGIMGGPARNLYTSGVPVESPEDLQGRQIRVENSPVKAETWKRFGADPVPLDWSEIYTALQSGVIDGAESSTDAYATSKFNEVAPALSLTGHEFAVMPLLLSERTYQDLSEDERSIVLELCDKASVRSWEDGWSAVDELEDHELESSGSQIVTPDVQAFQAAVSSLPERVADKYGAVSMLENIEDLAG